MIKPPLSGIPGVGVMNDTFDFVKNLWGTMNLPGMNLPGMAAPTLSVEELDKKINDLKAVEAWLNVNQTMLRGTIQALEVQRGTIATLKSVGASMSAAIRQQPPSEKAVLESSPYASAFLFPNAQPSMEESPETEKETGDAGASLTNPLAWWNVLQDQFKHAVNAAVVTDTMAKLGAAGTAMATDAVVKLGEVAAKSALGARPDASEPDAPPAMAKRIRKPSASKTGSSKAAGSKRST